MATQSPESPWLICDRATRTAVEALQALNRSRNILGMSMDDLAQRSGLNPMTVTRAMHGHGCNLAEFMALMLALKVAPTVVIEQAFDATRRETTAL